MSSIRNSRTRLLTAAAAVALATLSLTACDSGTDTKSQGASSASVAQPSDGGSSEGGSSGSNSSAGEAKQDGTTSGDAKQDGTTSGDAKQEGTTSGPAANVTPVKAPAPSARTVTCEGSNTKTVAAPLNRPVNHMLLTVTNTGSNTCFLYSYPAVRFGEAQSVPPVIKDSIPQAVVTLKPGESGYASVSLSATDGSASNGLTEHSLTVYFHGRSGNESVGAGAHPALPAKGVYIDDSLKVTYWQQAMDDAIAW